MLRGPRAAVVRDAQAVFEEAVADGSYFAGPDFEWEPGEAEMDH